MGPGTSRMNDLSVIQAAQGLCSYLEEVFGDEGKEKGVVVGFDHRGTQEVTSAQFAKYTGAVFASKGFKVYLYNDLVATPLVVRSTYVYSCMYCEV